MPNLFGVERLRVENFTAGDDVKAWKEREKASLDAWRVFFGAQRGLQLASEITSLVVEGSKSQPREVRLEENGHIGAKQQWTILEPDYGAASVTSINRLDPDLNSRISYLAESLKLEDPELIRRGIIRAKFLFDRTGLRRKLVRGEDSGDDEVALELEDKKRSILFTRYSSARSNENKQSIMADVKYYHAIGIWEPILLPGRLRRAVCQSLIFERGIQEPEPGPDNAALLFTRLCSLVFILSSHAAVGDSYADAEHTATTP